MQKTRNKFDVVPWKRLESPIRNRCILAFTRIWQSERVNMVFDVRWRQSKLKTPSALEFLWDGLLIYALFPWSTDLLKDYICLFLSRETHTTSDMYQRILCAVIRLLHKGKKKLYLMVSNVHEIMDVYIFNFKQNVLTSETCWAIYNKASVI